VRELSICEVLRTGYLGSLRVGAKEKSPDSQLQQQEGTMKIKSKVRGGGQILVVGGGRGCN